ncbi:MAG: DUF2304 family protein [Bacteroidota bacterium]
MQLELYKWLAPLIALFYIIRTVRQYGAGKYSPRNTVIWIIFWISIAMLGFMPDEIPNSLAKGLGFKDHINALIFVALGLLFLMVFYLSAAINRVENQLTSLVRKIALHENLSNPATDEDIERNIIQPSVSEEPPTETIEEIPNASPTTKHN